MWVYDTLRVVFTVMVLVLFCEHYLQWSHRTAGGLFGIFVVASVVALTAESIDRWLAARAMSRRK